MSLVVKDALGMAQTQLERNGRSDAKLDSELIFRHMFGVDKMGLFKLWGTTLDDSQCDQYFDLVAIRAAGKPLQYITGEQAFMGLSFEVNEKVLIPRQDTETLVEEVVSIIERSAKKKYTILDLCCGSGAIGISIASLCSHVKVTASDVSHDALMVARKNATKLKVEKKVTFVESDLLARFKRRFRPVQFDMIVSNPPYIESHIIPTLQTEVKDHEPLIALDGGPDGLDFYRRIIYEAPTHLKKDGILVLEIGHDQAEAVKALVNLKGLANEGGLANGGKQYRDVKIVQDLAGNDRVAVIEKL